MSAYVQSSIGCTRMSAGQSASVGAKVCSVSVSARLESVCNLRNDYRNRNIPANGSPNRVPTKTASTSCESWLSRSCLYSASASFMGADIRRRSRRYRCRHSSTKLSTCGNGD